MQIVRKEKYKHHGYDLQTLAVFLQVVTRHWFEWWKICTNLH